MRYFSKLFFGLFIVLFSISPLLSYQITPMDTSKKTQNETVQVPLKKEPLTLPKKNITKAKPVIQSKPVLDRSKLKINTIKVLQPTKNASYNEGSQMSISFTTNLKEPFKVELVKFNSKEKIMDCQVTSIHQQGNSDTYSTLWTVPQDNYNSMIKYGIRISKGSTEAFSEPFRIKNVLHTTVYEIPVTNTSNKLKFRSHNDNANRESPDPGVNKLRVGYSHFSYEDHFRNYIYRSWVFFDLSSLRGKGIVTKASLKFSQYAGCNTFTPYIYFLNDQWNGNAESLFSNVYKMSAVSPSALPTTRIFNWITKPESNYGFVFVGPNETLFAQDNDSCIGLFDNLILEVELTGE